MPQSISRLLMFAGLALFLLGGAFYLAARFNLPFGRLPGDFRYESGNFKFYFPLTTMIILSFIFTIVLNLFSRFLNR